MSDRASGPPVVERMTSFPRPQPTAHFRIDLEAAIHDRGAALLFWYTIAMIIGFVFIMVVKPLKAAYKEPIERLIALRNFAAHESPVSKRKAREAVSTNMSAAGAWLKRKSRFATISAPLKQLAADIESGAPF